MDNEISNEVFYIPRLENSERYAVRSFPYLRYLWDQIYQSQVTVEQNNKIKELIPLAKIPHNAALAGDVQEEYLLYKLDAPDSSVVEGEDLSLLKNALRPHILTYTNERGLSWDIESVWVNLQGPGEFQPHHSHSGVFSFVWYVDVPKVIEEENKSSLANSPARGAISFVSYFGLNHTGGKMSLFPQNRDFLLFTSGQIHSVYPFFSDVKRISISGNITLEKKDNV